MPILILLLLMLVAPAAYADYSTGIMEYKDNGLVARWTFDGASMAAEPGLPYTESAVKTSGVVSITGAVPGTGDGARVGSNQYIEIPNSTGALNMDRGTLMMWVKPTGGLTDRWIFQMIDTGFGGCIPYVDCPEFTLRWQETSAPAVENLQLTLLDPTGDTADFSTYDNSKRRHSIEVGEWHHIAITWDKTDPEGDVKLYVNGFLRMNQRVYTSRQLANPFDPNHPAQAGLRDIASPLYIGRYWNASVNTWRTALTADVDDLAIIDRPLDRLELQRLIGNTWGPRTYYGFMLSTIHNERGDGNRFLRGDIFQWSAELSKMWPSPGVGDGPGKSTGWVFHEEVLQNSNRGRNIDAFHMDETTGRMYLSFTNDLTMPGLFVKKGDVAWYDPKTHTAGYTFRGDFSFIAPQNVDAFSISNTGTFLMSTRGAATFRASSSLYGVKKDQIFEFVPDPVLTNSPAQHTWRGIRLDASTAFSAISPNVNAVHSVNSDTFYFSYAGSSLTYLPTGDKVRDGDVALFNHVTGELIENIYRPASYPNPYIWFSEDELESKHDVDALYSNFDPLEYAGLTIEPVNGTDLSLYCEPKQFLIRAEANDGFLWPFDTTTMPSATIVLDTTNGDGNWSVPLASPLNPAPTNITAAAAPNPPFGDGTRTYTFSGPPYEFMVELDNRGIIPQTTDPDRVSITARHDAVTPMAGTTDISFHAMGFRITETLWPATEILGTKLAGADPNAGYDLHVTAYGSGPAGGDCDVVEAYDGPKDLVIVNNYVDPVGPAGGVYPGVTAAGILPGGFGVTFTDVPFIEGRMTDPNFPGRPPLRIRYKDIGTLALRITDQPDGTVELAATASGTHNVLGTSSLTFIPHQLNLTATKNDMANTPNLGALCSSEPNGIFAKAGEPFKIKLEALDADGDGVPSIDPADVELTFRSLVDPVPGHGFDGLLKKGTGVKVDPTASPPTTPLPDGQVDYNAAKWLEIGTFTMRAELPNFKGTGDVLGADYTVGRFTPEGFDIRTWTPGEVAPACIDPDGNGAIMMGERFDFQTDPSIKVLPKGVGSIPLYNYRGDCMKLNSALLNPTYADTSLHDPNVGAGFAFIPVTTDPNTAPSYDFTLSFGPVIPSDPNDANTWFHYVRPLAGAPPVPAFLANLNTGFSLTDADGIKRGTPAADPNTVGTTIVGGGQLAIHHGRLRVDTGYGDERQPVDVPMFVESWGGNANGWLPLTGDCSSNALGTLLDSGDMKLAISEVGLIETVTDGGGPFNNGLPWTSQHDFIQDLNSHRIRVFAPGQGNAGQLEITIDLTQFKRNGQDVFEFLGNPNPKGEARFGIFKREDDVIFMREIY